MAGPSTGRGAAATSSPARRSSGRSERTVAPTTTVTYYSDADDASYDVAIVVVGERPYAEWYGDCTDSLGLDAEDLETLAAVRRSGVPTVVVLVSGRPLIVTDQLPDWRAFIAAWLPGSEGQGVADVLFGDFAPTGTLPMSWPRSASGFRSTSETRRTTRSSGTDRRAHLPTASTPPGRGRGARTRRSVLGREHAGRIDLGRHHARTRVEGFFVSAPPSRAAVLGPRPIASRPDRATELASSSRFGSSSQMSLAPPPHVARTMPAPARTCEVLRDRLARDVGPRAPQPLRSTAVPPVESRTTSASRVSSPSAANIGATCPTPAAAPPRRYAPETWRSMFCICSVQPPSFIRKASARRASGIRSNPDSTTVSRVPSASPRA